MIELGANVLYKEDELVDGLGCTRAWLRRWVNREGDVYRGEAVLEAMIALQPEGKEGSVYFIQIGADGPIKIGIAANVGARLRALQTAKPRQLFVRGTISEVGCALRLEQELHLRFAQQRIRGEWFAPHTDLLDFIKGYCG